MQSAGNTNDSRYVTTSSTTTTGRMSRVRSADDILDERQRCHDDRPRCHDDTDDDVIDVMSPPPKPPLDFTSIPTDLITRQMYVLSVLSVLSLLLLLFFFDPQY